MLKNFDELIHKVTTGKRKTVALVEANDEHSLEAVIRANDIVDSILVGDKKKIILEIQKLGHDPDSFQIVEPEEGIHPVVCAAQLIHDGQADFLMKGSISTATMLKGVLDKKADLRGSNLMSHLTIYQMPQMDKLICLTDGGMCTYPNLDQKCQILENSILFLNRLGYECPNVAALCAVEVVNPAMQETVDANTLKEMCNQGILPKCNFEGPISYDLAMSKEICKIKGFDTPYAEEFDLLLVPEIVVGNVLGKCYVCTCGGIMAGIILGCKVPIVLTSRGSSAEEKYYSLALAAATC